MKTAIVGSGIAGLTIAYRLSQKGNQVVIFEKERKIGGLASGLREKSWAWSLENFYHHLFANDKAAQKLVGEMGLADKLFYRQPKTSILKNNQITQFDNPISVLCSPEFSLAEKIRIGLITGYLKLTNDWPELEKIPAEFWLRKYYGKRIYGNLWQPLIRAKFGKQADKISMAWFWARIKKRTAKLGYLEGGFQILIDKLAEKIKVNSGKIYLNQEITKPGELNQFDRIIFTTPTSVFLKIMADKLPADYRKKIAQLKMIGSLNLILVLKNKFLTDGTYWLNINEPSFPFVAVVEHTNFVDRKHYGNNHLLYAGGYYPQGHRYFKMKKEEILKEFLPYLQKINPRISYLSPISYFLFQNLYSQPIIPVNYSQIIPQMVTPLPNVFLANMQMVYPWDRGINYAIEMGEKAANEILKNS